MERTMSITSMMSLKDSPVQNTTTTSFTVFSGSEHYRPNEGTQYFAPLTPNLDPSSTPPRICTVVFPFFNESKTELQRSLMEMYKQSLDCHSLNIEIHVVAIMDGWWKASDTMKEYIKELFPSNRTSDRQDDDGEVKDWWDHIDNIPEKSDLVETYIVQRLSTEGFVENIDVFNNCPLKLSLIIKRDNRRKHNSHEWFFQGFASHYNSEYAFATDCGTLYAKKCVFYLIQYMDANPNVSASTGRQRVMSSAMQSCEEESILAMWYRAGQAYDYEASISSFQGAFSLIGMLPVLPGPCGMYRYADITGECLDYYFSTVNISPDDTTMVTGNLLLAEDRILSYAAALVTGKFTVWVPHAIFYFEAETDTNKFISQRRRWTNGSFAGYIYLLITNPDLLFNSSHTWYFKVSSFFLLVLQLVMFLLVSISPAIFMSMGYYAVGSLSPFKDEWITKLIQYCILGAYAILYLLFIFVHNREKFVGWLYFPALIFNAVLFMFILSAIIVAVVFGDWVVLLIIGFIMGTPFLLSLLHSFESFLMMITTFIPFMFFLPTFVAWFAAYSFSRTWDLSWGNRPSDTMDSISKTSRDYKLLKMKRIGLTITVVLAMLNISIGFALTFIRSVNLFIWISIAISFPSLIQMFLSFFFFLFYTPHHSSAILYNLFGRSPLRVIGIVCSIISWILVLSATMSSNWVSRNGIIKAFPPDQSYFAEYGPLNTCVVMPTILFGTSSFDAAVLAGTYCGTYGPELSVDWPCSLWSVTFILSIVILLFGGISAVAICSSLFIEDKSRTDAISVLYMSAATMLIAAGMIFFPAGFGSASLERYKDFYWLLKDENPLCGTNSGMFKPGNCAIGSGYITFCFAFPFALVASYCYIAMNRKKSIKKKIVREDRLQRVIRRQSIQEKDLQSRLEKIENMFANGTVIVELDELDNSQSFITANQLLTDNDEEEDGDNENDQLNKDIDNSDDDHTSRTSVTTTTYSI